MLKVRNGKIANSEVKNIGTFYATDFSFDFGDVEFSDSDKFQLKIGEATFTEYGFTNEGYLSFSRVSLADALTGNAVSFKVTKNGVEILSDTVEGFSIRNGRMYFNAVAVEQSTSGSDSESTSGSDSESTSDSGSGSGSVIPGPDHISITVGAYMNDLDRVLCGQPPESDDYTFTDWYKTNTLLNGKPTWKLDGQERYICLIENGGIMQWVIGANTLNAPIEENSWGYFNNSADWDYPPYTVEGDYTLQGAGSYQGQQSYPYIMYDLPEDETQD